MSKKKQKKKRLKSEECAKAGSGMGFIGTVVILLGLAFALNFVWQIYRKPAELWALAGWGQERTPQQLWRDYGEQFERYQTDLVAAPLLAAIALVESSGNPLATPKWQWNWRGGLLNLYAPASSSVGMFQFTNSTFEEASRYCVVDGRVVTDGPWYDFRSCWFNSLYTRLSASDSIQLTSAYLHKKIEGWQERLKGSSVNGALLTRLAAVIHLCGPGKASVALDGKLDVSCGSHSVRSYIKRVERLESLFRQKFAKSDKR